MHISYISHAYLGHISGIRQVHIHVSHVYLGQISVKYLTLITLQGKRITKILFLINKNLLKMIALPCQAQAKTSSSQLTFSTKPNHPPPHNKLSQAA